MSDQQPHDTTPNRTHDGSDLEPHVDLDTSSILEDDDKTVVPPSLSRRGSGGGIGRRLSGLIAALFGLVGCLLSLAVAAVLFTTGLAAGDSAGTLIEPISSSAAELETRVDQTDDLVGRNGVDNTDLDLLAARADSLTDLADSVQQRFSAIADHPVYRWLPIDLEPLETVLGGITQSSESIAESAGNGAASGRLPAAEASQMSEEINQLQAGFGDVRAAIETGRDSLTRWIRLAALAGVVLALWSLWAQSWLLRRGWRAIRGHTP